MTTTYTPVSTDKDKVRLLIGDTDMTEALLQDEEIQFFVDSEGSAEKAAVKSCRAIATKFARLADTSVESVRISYSQKSENYSKMADKLDLQAQKSAVSASSVIPVAAGVSVAEMEGVDQNTDRPASQFKRGMFGNE